MDENTQAVSSLERNAVHHPELVAREAARSKEGFQGPRAGLTLQNKQCYESPVVRAKSEWASVNNIVLKGARKYPAT